jgi:hypothetical protein
MLYCEECASGSHVLPQHLSGETEETHESLRPPARDSSTGPTKQGSTHPTACPLNLLQDRHISMTSNNVCRHV